jgi:carbonic anhydrase
MSVLPRVTLAIVATMSSFALAEALHFTYSGANGPANWSKLSPDFAACQAGKNQSPIDISGAQDVDLPALDLEYSTLAQTFVNNGHAVQANYAAGSTLADDFHELAPNRAHVSYAAGSTIGHLGSTYELKQFHFHSPSEHQRDGKNLPAEIHFVHADPSGHLAVVGVFVTEGAAHPTIAQLWQDLPGDEGESNDLDGSISAADLLPASKDYRFYQGSLTTPPCSEGVRWLVMKESITMSADQIAALKKAIGFDNNRPVQPLNSRVIFE